MTENSKGSLQLFIERHRKSLWGLLAVLAPVIAVTLYMLARSLPSSDPNPGGLPGGLDGKIVSARPFASPSAPDSDNPVMSLPLDQLTRGLAKKLETRPNDLKGWTLLARSYATLGQSDKADEAFHKAIELAPRDAELRVSFGETLTNAADGRITPKAHKIFLDAQTIEPNHAGVRYFLALWEFQEGKVREAYDAWLQLAREAPQGAAWLSKIQGQLDQAATRLGVKAPRISPAADSPPQAGTPGPALTRTQVQAGQAMNSREQGAFIQSMVQRLANRLEKEPGDLEGWLRLGKSYDVLGEPEKSFAAYERALKLAPEDSQVRQLYEQARQKNSQKK
ncbi:MAG: tetratricopeptide repeat protein [Nitrospinaceae bacterium]